MYRYLSKEAKLRIRDGMLEVTRRMPITNDASEPMTLLRQILIASDVLGELDTCTCLEKDEILMELFPEFIEKYPRVMELDTSLGTN